MRKLIVFTCIASGAIILFFLLVGHSMPNDLDQKVAEALEYCKKNVYSS